MQGDDDFQPFFGLIASNVARSRPRQEHDSRDIQSSTDQSSSEEDDQESSQKVSQNSKAAPARLARFPIQIPENQNSQKCHVRLVSGCSGDFGTLRMRTDSCHTWKSKKIILTRFGGKVQKNWELSSSRKV